MPLPKARLEKASKASSCNIHRYVSKWKKSFEPPSGLQSDFFVVGFEWFNPGFLIGSHQRNGRHFNCWVFQW